jgi:phosphate transport system substrate-binding protein
MLARTSNGRWDYYFQNQYKATILLESRSEKVFLKDTSRIVILVWNWMKERVKQIKLKLKLLNWDWCNRFISSNNNNDTLWRWKMSSCSCRAVNKQLVKAVFDNPNSVPRVIWRVGWYRFTERGVYSFSLIRMLWNCIDGMIIIVGPVSLYQPFPWHEGSYKISLY